MTMSKSIYFENSTVFWGGDPSSSNLAASIVRAPNDDLVVVWSSNDYIEGSLESGPVNVLDILKHPGCIRGSISSDHGRTWCDPFVIVDDADGDPTLYLMEDKIVLCYSRVEYIKREEKILYQGEPQVYEKVSTDSGRSFGEPRLVDFGPKYWGCRASPIVLRSGTVVRPFYYVNNVDTEVLERDMKCIAGALVSKDGGNSWTRSGEIHLDIENGADEPSIVELSNGDLYMLIRTRGGCAYEALSSDEGLSWTDPRPTQLTSPSAPATLYRLSFEPNTVVVSWNNSPSDRFPLDIAVSYDDCRSWEHSRTLVNPGRQVAYPAITQAADGAIVVAYHEGPDRDKVKWYYMRHIMAARVSEAWIRS